ncbi:MAG: phenylalanine--tRNA ligase subunit alpha [Paludibacteraceae bacterium]|nr:phenylalanine--tRNA ligase subunit alpha [Paludibacteraceae bacterium]
MKDRVESLQAQVEKMNAANQQELETLRLKFMSKKGEMGELMDEFKALPKEEKAQWGQTVNALRQTIEARFNDLKTQLAEKNEAVQEKTDLTRTPDSVEMGSRHPLSLVREEIVDIFSRIGFTVADGPEVEDDRHVFSLLNFAPEHPARDMQDTFFIEKEEGVQKPTDILLRTHTSSVQTRIMLSQQPPIRVLCPGRVYRNEAISARAHCFFHQVEGLYIDKNVSFADLRQTLLYFAKEMFGADTKIRLRPSYFPFTEPSAEMDISCDLCGGKGCAFCKGTGWVEILGCGMVDPNVLEACGIDSKVYSGYAFGMGVERITNLKYRVKDLRLFSENDVRFLSQFESC